MAGSWRVGVFVDREGVEVHKRVEKKRGHYPAILTEQAWSIKDLFRGKKKHAIVQRDTENNPERDRVANDSVGFGSSCLPAELVI